MTAAMALPGNTAAIFLTHFFGSGLADDDRHVVERFKAMADGDTRRCPDAAPAAKSGRRKTKAATVTLKAVKELRPAPTEIIVCTGLRTRGGVQYWGAYRRHSWASAAAMNGVDMATIAKPLRHALVEAAETLGSIVAEAMASARKT